MKSCKTLSAVLILVAAPLSAYAASPRDLRELIGSVMDIINLTVPVIFGLAVLAFLYGILKYIFARDIKKIDEARNLIVFGVIGLAVMLSVWGLARFVKNTFFENAPTSFSVDGLYGGSNQGGYNTGGSSNPPPCVPGGLPGEECIDY